MERVEQSVRMVELNTNVVRMVVTIAKQFKLKSSEKRLRANKKWIRCYKNLRTSLLFWYPNKIQYSKTQYHGLGCRESVFWKCVPFSLFASILCLFICFNSILRTFALFFSFLIVIWICYARLFAGVEPENGKYLAALVQAKNWFWAAQNWLQIQQNETNFVSLFTFRFNVFFCLFSSFSLSQL